ncbi:MAG: hypothetical protein LBI05_07315 [Planctomycetaceae bacterium]|jgi:hypothetical protein|nr:hypothetical protein [Planctomycetaceae bacterium]
MTLRNIILIIGVSLFLLWYVGNWAYQTQYVEPRKQLGDEITKLSGEIERGKNMRDERAKFNEQNLMFYFRSLPRVPNDARSQYNFWLLELLQYSGLESPSVADNDPALIPLGADYRFNIQCTGTLSQLSYFLFEFYYAPYLHRFTSITMTPTEGNREKKTFVMVVDALALRPRDENDPYPLLNQLPAGEGWNIPRLVFNDPAAYQVIENRDILQTAKGGIDRADYTFLTAILLLDDQTEIWFSVQTDDSLIKAKLGDTINSGSFTGKIVEIHEQDIVLDRNGARWLLTTGESLHDAFALPPETAITE